jgi:hypothetical protein
MHAVEELFAVINDEKRGIDEITDKLDMSPMARVGIHLKHTDALSACISLLRSPTTNIGEHISIH